ncbi:hypothetical protein [Alicyclobacillus fodiniaquatilis]|uniref:Uncharacterized protein n=1 Tax=Alicyclobacillus fodiniaquatilis TaxID=1661150 RepID=A0ABW4JGN6_9BACL
MGWVYYLKLMDTKFQATCFMARLEEERAFPIKKEPKYIATFQTVKGRFGVKVLLD